MDGCILVVAATDGTMPQTREHLILTKQIGIKKLVVFINKADAVDAEMIELVEMEIRELLTELGFDGENTPIVTGSALNALNAENPTLGKEKVMELLGHVDDYIEMPVRDLDKDFSMPVEGVMVVTGRGVVVTGKLDQGRIKKGDECEIVGYDKKLKAQITGIEMFRQMLDHGEAGDQMGCLVKGAKKTDLRKGMVLSKPGLYGLNNKIEAQLYLLKPEEGGRTKPLLPFQQTVLFNKSFSISTHLEIPDRDMIMPGEDTKAVFVFFHGMAVGVGDRFTLRDGRATVGYGVITNILPNIDIKQYEADRKAVKKAEKKAKDAEG